MQTLQPYIESGLVDYHWVNRSMLPARGEAGKMPPQLAVSKSRYVNRNAVAVSGQTEV